MICLLLVNRVKNFLRIVMRLEKRLLSNTDLSKDENVAAEVEGKDYDIIIVGKLNFFLFYLNSVKVAN